MVKQGGSLSGLELNKFIKASYAKKSDRPKQIGDYILDEQLSKSSVSIYHNPITKKAVVTHRGTSPTISDWKNNLDFIRGNYESTDRFKRSKEAQEKAEAKYGSKNIDTVGHSQGSILANKLGKNSNHIINVNPAYISADIGANETNIRSSGDIVSSLLNPISSIKNLFGEKKSKIETIKAESYNPLKEHSSDILLKDTEKIYGGYIMSGLSKDKIAFFKEHGIVIRKVRGMPHYVIKVDKKPHSIHDTKKDAKHCMCGGGFWKDFSHGFKEGFLGTAKAVQGVASFDPDKVEEGTKRISRGARNK